MSLKIIPSSEALRLFFFFFFFVVVVVIVFFFFFFRLADELLERALLLRPNLRRLLLLPSVLVEAGGIASGTP
tara:strand:+ start:592 stop:810 length:219 start_codon:yes stop_codon:yes gene_type:complete